jgi:hypothetical protein
MIVGGPLRGYNRALRVSLNYCIRYFLLESVLALAVGPFLMGWGTVGFLVVLLVTVLMSFPTALFANMVFARLFGFRTWRKEQWRHWTAGALGVVLTTVGILLVGVVIRPPPFLFDLPGQSGGLLYGFGWFVLFSNLPLLVAWSLPGRRRAARTIPDSRFSANGGARKAAKR